MTESLEREPLVGYLERLRDKDDRGALAALRRALGKPPGEAPEAYPYVVPFLPREVSAWQEQVYYLVAALFAVHPEAGGQGNLGDALRRIGQQSGLESAERRLVLLLGCHPEDLPSHLRHVVSLARSKQVPIDWRQLMGDLRYWNRDDRLVQRRWARGFWGVPAEDTTHEQTDGQ